ncbi:VOC family protein [Persicitalea sp.]|uniref:VOC family protein n=1 Tax=Persicitalea sp. TaxID=3100273 RepID=UPI003593E841
MNKSRIIPSLLYNDAEKAIEWLCDAFGFDESFIYQSEDGKIAHAELTYKGSMIMLGSAKSVSPFSKLIRQPQDSDGFETQSPYVIIDEKDIEGHYNNAKLHDAKIAIEFKTESYGGKSYSCYDPEGHLWCFGSYDPWEVISK